MFLFVEITPEAIIPGKSYQDKATGMMRPAQAKQNAYLHSGKAYPLPFMVKVPESGPYKPGRYLMTGEVFKTGEYGLDYRGSELQLCSFDDAAAIITGKPAIQKAA
ncbi:hypothetical protein [Novosphingobium sp. P6W]|uniref:hypothetical protein n=1 Tax=Novosphingobium sp. P6W TaxID=1609758 RepID=UPI0005C2EB71|nr:hypothetical protein [Novosphingobium sp. P6W]AXB79776.1 hypothetical protein TQ38_025485 [Novosphingobium sp. P6W]KIS30651.1 hypothetical protein TQ38_21265 [Novosphingobium sp. P6W]